MSNARHIGEARLWMMFLFLECIYATRTHTYHPSGAVMVPREVLWLLEQDQVRLWNVHLVKRVVKYITQHPHTLPPLSTSSVKSPTGKMLQNMVSYRPS